jgi:hypothetical protein
VGKDAHPSAAIMDSQSVKTVEESARIRGFDAHKHVKGRKRYILVDTLGLPLAVYVTPADLHDTQGARRLLAGLKYFVPQVNPYGPTPPTAARNSPTGVRRTATGTWTWSNELLACVDAPLCPSAGSWNGRSDGCRGTEG